MITYEGRLQILNKLRAVGGYFLLLYLDSAEPDETTEAADLTEASFTGYSAASAPFDAASLNGDNDGEMHLSAPVVFTCSGAGSPQVVYGAALVDTYGGGNKLMDVKHFPAPITIDDAGQTITIEDWRFRQGDMA